MEFTIELNFYKNEGWTFERLSYYLNKKHIYKYNYVELKNFYQVQVKEGKYFIICDNTT
jgi:hypothetical protein